MKLAIILRLPTLIAMALFSFLVVIDTQAQTLGKDEIATLLTVSDAERGFVLKTAENRIFDSVRKMMSDPENQHDGYQWARKVTAVSLLLLSKECDHLNMSEMALFYAAKSEALAKRIRGEITAEQLKEQELALSGPFQEQLDRLLKEAPSKPSIAISQLTEIASKLAARIHGYSVLSVTK